MKVIKSDTGFVVYQKIFKQLMADQATLVLWQVLPEDGKREITNSKINDFHFESGKLIFDMQTSSAVRTELPLYCYAEAGPLIFKAKIQEVQEKHLSLNLPPELRLLDGTEVTYIKGSVGIDLAEKWEVKKLDLTPEEIDAAEDKTVVKALQKSPNQANSEATLVKRDAITPPVAGPDIMKVKSSEPPPPVAGPDIMKVKSMAQRSSRDQDLLNQEFGPSVDEEEKMFAGQRASPRARPKMVKSVKILRKDQPEPLLYKLFDLSRGGMAFVSETETEFNKGDSIVVAGFNDFTLDDPLVGKIMSIRAIDETLKEFKVGVKFSDGQS